MTIKVIKSLKKMFVWGVCGVNTQEIINHVFIEEIFKSVQSRYEYLDKKMENSGFSFTDVRKLTI